MSIINIFKINLNFSFDNYILRGFVIAEINKNKSTHCFECDNITKNIILFYGTRHKGSFEKKIIVAWLSLSMKTISSTCNVWSSETSENICSSNGNIIKK
jgi:hypothetical protein